MTYYFAFGSNLWLDQMAKRCPESVFVGRAILPDYQWQINQRGYANVVPSAGSCVHGLVFKINKTDEAQLDLNEGVRIGAYEKLYLDVALYAAAAPLPKRTSEVLSYLESRRDMEPVHGASRSPVIEQDVLVYLSTRFKTPGSPHAEYVNRINHGIRHALQLGVPSGFFENAVRPFVPPVAHAPIPRSP